MSYAIIRNQNYKKDNLAGIYKHNERKNTNYSNENIDKNRSKNNYAIKRCNTTYQKRFNEIKDQYNFKGRIISTTNLMCEVIITSDKDFFDEIGEFETKRYFETAYKFIASYQGLGEEYIVSANVHMDEKTPHMHLVYIPVMKNVNKKTGEQENKIACSQYWKGKDSYTRLQNNYYSYMVRAGFNLERGMTKDNEHIPIEKFKKITNYEMLKYDDISDGLEKEVDMNNIELVKEDYRRVIRRYNKLAKQYIRIKTITDEIMKKAEKVQKENKEIQEENQKLESENRSLKNELKKTFEYVSVLFNFPINRLKRLVKDFIERMRE